VRRGRTNACVQFAITSLVAIGVLDAIGLLRAQPPSLSAVRVQGTVEFDSRDLFTYRYVLENGAASNAAIWRMAIDISVPAGPPAPASTGLSHGPGYFATSLGGVRNLKLGVPVPVGLSAPQPGWRTTIAADATARWMGQGNNLVFPKQKLAGFSLASHGPPAIRRFTLAPYVDREHAPVMAAGDDPGEEERFEQDLEHYIESRSVTGFTLAPTAVTATTDAVLAGLASQITQARSLRWISTDAAARSVTDRLQTARAAIAKRQPDLVVSALTALQKEMAAQSGKSFTSEAIALVDLNLRYALGLIAK